MTTRLDGKSVTVPAVLLALWPNQLRLELQDPVGGMLALVVVNGKEFWLYQRERPYILTGPLGKNPFSLLPRGSAEDLLRIFLARPPIREQRSSEKITWDEKMQEPLVWSRKEKRGALSASYEDYEFREGARYPTKLRLSSPGEDGRMQEVILVWKDWKPSVPSGQKLFQIPQQQTFGRKIKALH